MGAGTSMSILHFREREIDKNNNKKKRNVQIIASDTFREERECEKSEAYFLF